MNINKWLLCILLACICINAKSQDIQTIKYKYHKITVCDSKSFETIEELDVSGLVLFTTIEDVL